MNLFVPQQKNNLKAKEDAKSSSKRFSSFKGGGKFATFFIFLLLSIMFWWVQSLQAYYIERLTLPIKYKNLNKYAVSGELPQTLEVELRDQGIVFLFNYTFSSLPEIELDIAKFKEDNNEKVSIPSNYLVNRIEKALPSSSKIKGVSPQEINLKLYPLETKIVAIKSQLEPIPQDGFIVTKRELLPKNIKIYGSKKNLRKIRYVYTEELSVEQKIKELTLEKELSLQAIKDVRFEEVKIIEHIVFDELIEKNFEKRVHIENLPKGFRLRLLPSLVSLRVTVPKAMYSRVKASDFDLYIDYNDLSKEDGAALQVKLKNSPIWVERYLLTPSKIQYILESI